ncbi:MAG: Cof-type HAD-IIB family hydrolase, partial [Thermotogae bacterium]
NDNDIPLLQEAGIGVAVDNATDALKEVADKIVPSNIEGGPGVFVLDMLNSFE